MLTHRIPLFIVFSGAFLSGCSSTLNIGESTFACKDEGGCPTPIEVYEKTHTTPPEVMVGRTPKSWKDSPNDTVVKFDKQNILATKPEIPTQIKVDAEQAVLPMREGAKVMRVWIAPWVDEDDRLNWASYSFVEVTPRKWKFGEREVRVPVGVPFVRSTSDDSPSVNRP